LGYVIVQPTPVRISYILGFCNGVIPIGAEYHVRCVYKRLSKRFEIAKEMHDKHWHIDEVWELSENLYKRFPSTATNQEFAAYVKKEGERLI
jgi:hypothetical protein